MLPYSEKRKYPRMDVECPARFRLQGSEGTDGAIVKSLSGGGLLMWIDCEVEPGSRLAITILPGKSVTPPLSVEVEVTRCHPLESGEEGSFAIACVIEKVVEEAPQEVESP